jgi:hypothetical protein
METEEKPKAPMGFTNRFILFPLTNLLRQGEVGINEQNESK